jgi:5-methylcytosine-specific restriction endonuclease McrA
MQPTSLGKARGGRADDRPELSPEYRAYLASPAWAELRGLVLLRDCYRCVVCWATEGLEVHHLTYERLGHEPLSDLITLCAKHHEIFDQTRRKTAKEDRRRKRTTARRRHGS